MYSMNGRIDYGRLFENAVYLELKRDMPQQHDIHNWKSNEGFDADFVIHEGLAIKEIIHVAYELNSVKTKDREVRGLAECARESGLDHGLIITKDLEKVEFVGGIKINFMPLWKWLLKL